MPHHFLSLKTAINRSIDINITIDPEKVNGNTIQKPMKEINNECHLFFLVKLL